MNADKLEIKLPVKAQYLEYLVESIDLFMRFKYSKYQKSIDDIIHQETKILLHELYTNCINHIKGESVSFAITFLEDEYFLEMLCTGAGFSIKPVNPKTGEYGNKIPPPYPQELIGKNIIVHRDEATKVLCRVESSNKLSFARIERPDTVPGDSIPEHFGMLLITGIANSVTYEQRPENLNYFSMQKKF